METKGETTTLGGINDFSVGAGELDELWIAALGEIEIQVSKPNFITWFKNSHLLIKEGNGATISLPNNFAKEWIENKYCKVVLGALRALDETITKVDFVVAGGKEAVAQKKRTMNQSPAMSVAQTEFPEFKIDPETNLNPKYTLASFIVGKSNELPYAAASAVVEDVGSKYNPLFIYGGVGLGKTHLMQAVGNEIKERYQGRIKVRYVSSEKFTNDVVWGIRNKRMESLKEKYRNVDVLIIDDIQFVIGKTSTEEEFFHTFNALYENNKQIIISSDKPPKFMPHLAERLRSRFEGGMMADIDYPDYELRFSIIKAKLADRQAQLTEEVVQFVATKLNKNFREIEGALNRILFFQKTKGAVITPKMASEIIDELVQAPSKNISPNEVLRAVADSFEVSIAELESASRKRELVHPRQIAMFLLREMLDLSYPNIGEKLGNRDHTTALYAYEKIAKEAQKNQALSQKIMAIRELISGE
ncbi:MAG: chromosomal replication initiator protein DnaA [Candidatus Harrisonbacteria bacterium CG10_big_fil_rev_8_21_14_0_10_45_28]|uniref:Chromosomal replication initiator protein DnaA n=1 Tax=Candidatus Harrisonbacteria bacterium CG10_big_fil_rev_8_21_14_0_10_45_28 TaxID=1974586 RepID=A0A2H0UN88_9BACT|nr:MAG: chromosomal replication initiator protein DnaA [Candidatus Harrisonbacteria bacterium CG10_big_fil_rev_8_21_14_0_10_45_28]